MSAFVLSEAPFCPFMLLQLALWGLGLARAVERTGHDAGRWRRSRGARRDAGAPELAVVHAVGLVIALAFDKQRRAAIADRAADAARLRGVHAAVVDSQCASHRPFRGHDAASSAPACTTG